MYGYGDGLILEGWIIKKFGLRMAAIISTAASSTIHARQCLCMDNAKDGDVKLVDLGCLGRLELDYGITGPCPDEYEVMLDFLEEFGYIDFHDGMRMFVRHEAKAPREKPSPVKKTVYILDTGNGLYKIGFTKNINRRVKELYPATVYRTWEVLGARKVEKALHEMFSNKRKSGEWFELTQAELATVDEFMGGREV